jgi:hypothetical protein
METWGARLDFATFVITLDKGCSPECEWYGRYKASAKMGGGDLIDLGFHDTLEEAKAAVSRAASAQARPRRAT